MATIRKRGNRVLESSIETLEAAAKLTPTGARCKAIAEHGIKSANDLSRFLSAVVADVIAHRIEKKDANRLNAAAGKVLRILEQKL